MKILEKWREIKCARSEPGYLCIRVIIGYSTNDSEYSDVPFLCACRAPWQISTTLLINISI